MTELTLDEKLVLLIEECSEVIQAATKCLRFGFDGNHIPEYGINRDVLAQEIGDMLGVIDALPIDHDFVAAARAGKMQRAAIAKQKFGKG